MEAFLVSAAAFSQSDIGKADLVQAAADAVEKASKLEASTLRNQLRRYKIVKKLIRHFKSFVFSTRKPSEFQKCFVESIQANVSASELRGDDLMDALDMDLQRFPLINGEIGLSPTGMEPEEYLSQTPAQGTEPDSARSLQEIPQDKDHALPQVPSLSSAASPQTGHTVANPAGEGGACLPETASQDPVPQKSSSQNPTVQGALPQDAQETGPQETSSMSYPALVERSVDTWNLRTPAWDSESIWTYDASSSSCNSHSDVDELPPACSNTSSSSSYQVLTDTAEDETEEEALSPTMVMWLSRRQPQLSEAGSAADSPSAAQTLRLTAKLRPSVPELQSSVLDQTAVEESCQEPLGTEAAAK